jgi:hypothetical protein
LSISAAIHGVSDRVDRKRTDEQGPTYTGGFLGSLVGSFVPMLWGAGQFSMSSMVFFVIGGLAGIWLAYRLFA